VHLELVVDGGDVELLALLPHEHPRLLGQLHVVDAPARDGQVLRRVGDPEARYLTRSAREGRGLDRSICWRRDTSCCCTIGTEDEGLFG
jgi:hypothetical protein